MTQQAHTKTPWVLDHINILDNDGDMLAFTVGSPKSNVDTMEANAKFIVKAVNSHHDLFFSLRELITIIETFEELEDLNKELDHPFPIGEAIKQAKQALKESE